jgi:hypothetical protein
VGEGDGEAGAFAVQGDDGEIGLAGDPGGVRTGGGDQTGRSYWLNRCGKLISTQITQPKR